MIADTAVVERDPGGLSAEEQTSIVERAVDATSQDAGGDEIALALPILNTAELAPGARESGTTAVTHLFFSGGASLSSRVDIAHEYAAGSEADGFAGVATAPLLLVWRSSRRSRTRCPSWKRRRSRSSRSSSASRFAPSVLRF